MTLYTHWRALNGRYSIDVPNDRTWTADTSKSDCTETANTTAAIPVTEACCYEQANSKLEILIKLGLGACYALQQLR